MSEVTTLVKVTALAAIILGAFLLGNGSLSNMTEGGAVHGGGLARAVASVIWTYDGWIAVSMIAGEVVAPERLMKRIIIVGMLVIVTLYIGANLAYLYMMPVGVMFPRASQQQILHSPLPTADPSLALPNSRSFTRARSARSLRMTCRARPFAEKR